MKQGRWTILSLIVAAALVLAACVPLPPVATSEPTSAAPGSAAIPNPASQNCIDKGGRLEIETRGDGGQFGVCYFEDNRQCEEWALMRRECPVGGVKVTGYVTEAARFCAITGGEYAITGPSGAADEQGTCKLPGGAACDAWDYYNGKCDASTGQSSALDAAQARGLAEQAYTFAYPMLEFYKTIYGSALLAGAPSYRAPLNEITHATRLIGPEFKDVVRPNNDTLYSSVWLDLRAEPMVISVPAIPDRYYSFQLIDVYTHNFAYIGTRATGTDAGSYLIAGPGWQGETPPGIGQVFRTEGNFAYSLTRTLVDGEADLPNVLALQQQYRVEPLSAYLKQPTPPAATLVAPPYDAEAAASVAFIRYFNFLLGQVAIHPTETDLIASFAPLGIGPDAPFGEAQLDPALREAIAAGVSDALAKIQSYGPDLGEQKNGWTMTRRIFGNREQMQGKYLERAAAAYYGLFGNDLEEAYYPSLQVGADGKPLDGAANYTLRFEKDELPPVNAFWSLTMYSLPDQLLVANPIERYSIGDRTPGLKYGEDGSLEIYIQAESPGADKESNWLPAPKGPFSLTMRMYLPKPSALDPMYAPPPLKAAGAGALVPLKDALATLTPRLVFERFYDLTQIPRPSGQTQEVAEYLTAFSNSLNLETTIDAAGNVLIRKPAALGMEGKPTVILQGHMDMVPQKTPESTHDFTKDPISAYLDGGWIKADGTTLGADDGIGMALALALLQDESLRAGPIEALFTVDEETTMTGANGLVPGELEGRILINLDSETEGEFTIGSAGGEHVDVAVALEEVPTAAGAQGVRVTVAGLTGGHSGVDIDKGRGHAIQLLLRLLEQSAQPFDLALAETSGGTAPNAIPREATALVAVPADQVTPFLAAVSDFEKAAQAEFAATDPGVTITATLADAPARVLLPDAQAKVLAALAATPQGIITMSPTVPGLPQTSNNVGILKMESGALSLTCFPRSSVDADLDAVAQTITEAWLDTGGETTITGRFSGWNPNPDSPIVKLMKQVYGDMFQAEPKVGAIHAGLECGTIAAMYPGMDAISVGPTLKDVHTPGERLDVASVAKLCELLVETLKRVE